MKKTILNLALLLVCYLVIPAKIVYAAPSITNISDNQSTYTNAQVPRFEKFESTFQVSTVSQNYFLSYDEMTTAIPGLTPKLGVSVDGVFLPPGESNWANAYRQPGFYYVGFSENGSLFYPTGSNSWKVRFSPHVTGIWQYKITVKDSSGSVESPIGSFTVASSANHGFVQVSPNDSRYFQFSDGTYFPGLSLNQGLDKNSPVTGNTDLLSKLGGNGIQVLRFWLSNWSIFGSTWTPWEGIKGTYDGYLPRAGLITNRPESTTNQPESVLTLVYSESGGVQNSGSWFDACHLSVAGGSQVKFATKANTSYHIKIRYQARGITGPRDPAFSDYGFVIKSQNPNDGNWHTNCFNGGDPQNGVKLTGYGHDTSGWTQDANGSWSSPNWATLESDWTSVGTNTPILYLALENAKNMTSTLEGKAYDWHPYVFVDSIEIRENLANNQYGPNIVYRNSFSSLEHIDERNAYAFDKTLDVVKANGVYLKMVLLDKNEQVENELGQNGGRADFSNNNFYGNWRYPQASRWYQNAWFRYLQARWGYSTAIHSWELVNEGDPSNGNHYALTDELGKYMHCSAFGITIGTGDSQKCTYQHPDRHMVTTSFWYGFPKTDFWGNNKYPNLDYADVHDYINKPSEPNHYYDTALSTYDIGSAYGAKQSGGAGMPVIRGETALITDDGTDAVSSEIDTKGVWLHNFIWGEINPFGATESWWHVSQIYSGSRDLRPLYKQYYDFISNVPLSSGKYQDAAAVATDTNIRIWGQKDSVGQAASHAHFWVQNKKHLWCAVNGTSGCPTTWDSSSRLNGTVSVTGFVPNTSFPVEWWNFDNNVVLTKSTSTVVSDSTGKITLDVSALPSTVTDTGVKIGSYTALASPTPTPSLAPSPYPKPGDADGNGKVDGVDYVTWFNHYNQVIPGGNTVGDFDTSGKVDGVDYTIWFNNYGK